MPVENFEVTDMGRSSGRGPMLRKIRMSVQNVYRLQEMLHHYTKILKCTHMQHSLPQQYMHPQCLSHMDMMHMTT